MIIVLLGIIALIELYRVFYLTGKVNKKRHFENKISETERTIWELEFKVFQMRKLREDIRQERSDVASKLAVLEESIASQKNKPAKEDVEKYLLGSISGEEKERLRKKTSDEFLRLLDDMSTLLKDIERFDLQLSAIDTQIKGESPTSENTGGAQGIEYQIDSFVEVKELLKKWRKNL